MTDNTTGNATDRRAQMPRAVRDHFIDGRWMAPATAGSIDVHDSNTGQVIGSAPDGSSADVETAVAAARRALPAWRATAVTERARLLRGVADGLEVRQKELAELIAREVGAPMSLAMGAQTMAAIINFRAAADLAESFDYRTTIGTSVVVREPVGVVAAVTAWNFPLHLVTVKSSTALAAGCTVVVKPSEFSPLTAAVFAEVVEEVGLPAGTVNVVFGTGAGVGEPLVSHEDVAMVTFTGSTRAGKRIGEICAAQVKRATLELGGKSPLVILDGANLQRAVSFGVADLMVNNGQRCDALTRMVVPRGRLGEVEELVRVEVEGYALGASTADTTQVGPMVSDIQRKRVHEYIEVGVAEGAKVVTGGPGRPDLAGDLADGYFVRPTVFSDVDRSMRIVQEEIFGPVLVLQAYDEEEDAVEIANDTVYGLHAGVWAADADTAIAFASKIEAGMITINDAGLNMAAPFGGYKQSGLGREFGRFGFEEFLEIKKLEVGEPGPGEQSAPV